MQSLGIGHSHWEGYDVLVELKYKINFIGINVTPGITPDKVFDSVCSMLKDFYTCSDREGYAYFHICIDGGTLLHTYNNITICTLY